MKPTPWQVAILEPKTPEERQHLLDQFHSVNSMTTKQFNRAISLTRMPADSATTKGVRLALVDGLSCSDAAREVGVDRSAISVATKRVLKASVATHCPTCKRAI